MEVQESKDSSGLEDEAIDLPLEDARLRIRVMLISIMLIATNGVIYELLIGGYSSYLLGDSITQFSLTIGLFMSSMGIGSWLTQRVEKDLEKRFVEVEIWLSAIGGPAVLILAMAHIYTRIYSWVMFALIIALGCLIGFEIPLVTRIVRRYGSLKAALANVLSFDYIGALFGSLLFPLVLLPELGFSRTAFAISFVNIGVAFVNLWVFRKEIGSAGKRLAFASWLVAFGLGIGFLFSSQWIETAREKATGHTLLHLQHTPYQTIRMIRDDRADPKRPVIRLYLNGEHQFSSDTENRYHEALVHPTLLASKRRTRILILGGGDGLALREVWKYPDVKAVTLVDLDPAMVALGRKHPFLRRLNQRSLDDPRLTLLHQDASLFLRQPQNPPFDAVIIDLPVPATLALSKLYTVDFYRQLRSVVHPDATITTEAATLDPVEKAPFWCLETTQRAAGWKVFPYVHGTAAFLMMRQTPLLPHSLFLHTPTSYLNDSLLQLAFLLPPDVQLHTPSPVNTLETHHMMHLILQMR